MKQFLVFFFIGNNSTFNNMQESSEIALVSGKQFVLTATRHWRI